MKRNIFATEVVQTSAMDCGPAALKCIMEGFGVKVSYGRLREACQTDVDGTSIDTLEEIAIMLGLKAEQIMLPVDHIVIPEAQALPAIAVTLLPNGTTHFIVLWRRIGPYIQIMDPATGRRWIRVKDVLNDLFVHSMPVPAEDWFDWAKTDDFLIPLKHRMEKLSIESFKIQSMINYATEKDNWQNLAALDAAVRMGGSLVQAKGIQKGEVAGDLIERLVSDIEKANELIPESYWSVLPLPCEQDGEVEQVSLRGAVILRVLGVEAELTDNDSLSPELAAALEEPPVRPGSTLITLLRKDGILTPTILLTALCFAAIAVLVEALLLRGILDIGVELELIEQRFTASLALIVFVLALLLIEIPIMSSVYRMGRHLEIRLRIAFLKKIPKLGDRYFHSRPISDMAERSHSIHSIRQLPHLGEHLLRSTLILCLTTAGIIWLDPSSTLIAIIVALLAILLPLLIQPSLSEQELRVRTHDGALGRYYLDTLLGIIAIRTHAAEKSIQGEHESLLVEWCRASKQLQKTIVLTEGIQSFFGFGLAAWLLINHLGEAEDMGAVLLLAYWALNLPVLGQEIALTARQYPTLRNRTLRLLEPLTAPEESLVSINEDNTQQEHLCDTALAISMHSVNVRAGGHDILNNIDIDIRPGTHVAIVGRSGAGKSSLVSLLLGWHKPSSGQIHINGHLLDQQRLRHMRKCTAWIDPSVQLWNRSLLDNLRYGNSSESDSAFSNIISTANLMSVLNNLPDGLQTSLGEGGGLISGGEGQRVRIGRAMLRHDAKLVVLDEPFRGLDRNQRKILLERVRIIWSQATLLCVTHDVEETLGFDEVIVIDKGLIIEQGSPVKLKENKDSSYCQLLSSENTVRKKSWKNNKWKKLHLDHGKLTVNN